ncbi:MAG TPA: cyclase family protein, partial [Bacteroidota bacterium]|nr:cyclase family protein [Bacteroidota bacterium]
MQTKIIDLTHTLNENVTVYPDTVAPRFEVINTVTKSGFAELKMTSVLHVGTHIDAPCHILEHGKSLDQFPIDKFVGKAMVIPCQNRKEIDLQYLQTFEDKIAQIDFIIFFTGWQYKWNTERYFDNSPIPTSEAARWLTKFNLNGIGIDSFSVDKVFPANDLMTEELPNHNMLLAKEI